MRRTVGLLIAFKAAYLMFFFAAVLLWPDRGKTFEDHFAKWDAKYYLSLAQHGYKRGAGSCAFYPLFPLAIRQVSLTTGGHWVVTGMLLSNIFSLAAFVIFYRLVERRYREPIAALALLLLLTFPGSLFFQFTYTESLFLLLAMILCSAMESGDILPALVAAYLMPLTRAVGIFCLFPILWFLYSGLLSGRLGSFAKGSALAARLSRIFQPSQVGLAISNIQSWRGRSGLCLALAPLLGWATYFSLMRLWTGNAFEGFEAQDQFGVESIHNIFDPVRFIKLLFHPTQWHGYTGSVLDRCMFILVFDCLAVIWKLDKSWFVWTFFLGMVPAMSGGFTSYTRFGSVVFPFFVALAVFSSRPGLRFLRWLLPAVFATLHLVLLWGFAHSTWAG